MRRALIALAVTFVSVLSACSSSGSDSQPTTTAPTVVQPTESSVDVSTTGAPDPLVAWCALEVGQDKASVVAAMGAPVGDKVATYMSQSGLSSQVGPGVELVEWDIDNSLLAATFTNGIASNLQAYDQAVGPAGATNINCSAFRH
jgi:hypothetical protein